MQNTGQIKSKDMESPLHKASGLAQAITAYAPGDYTSDTQQQRLAAVHSSLGLLEKLLDEARAASDDPDRSNLHASWRQEVDTAIAVTKVIRGQFDIPREAETGHIESMVDDLDLTNALWSLADQVHYIRTLALWPDQVIPRTETQISAETRKH